MMRNADQCIVTSIANSPSLVVVAMSAIATDTRALSLIKPGDSLGAAETGSGLFHID
jgi:hypothetical protein